MVYILDTSTDIDADRFKWMAHLEWQQNSKKSHNNALALLYDLKHLNLKKDKHLGICARSG